MPTAQSFSNILIYNPFMFGISSFCLHHEPLPDALEKLSEITGLVEIMDDGRHFVISPDVLEQFSLDYAFHAPCRSINIASLHEPIRRASVEVLGECFSVAKEVDAPVVIHPGYFAWEEERDRALAHFHTSLSELEMLAREHGITYYVENMGNWNYFFLRFPEELDTLENLKLALDVGHAHLNHCLDGFLSRSFYHVHLHDNDGREDTHVAVGEGTIDFNQVMEVVRRTKATPIVEVGTFQGVVESLRALDGL
jgi:sugar phosphate isomerase/epimerase